MHQNDIATKALHVCLFERHAYFELFVKVRRIASISVININCNFGDKIRKRDGSSSGDTNFDKD